MAATTEKANDTAVTTLAEEQSFNGNGTYQEGLGDVQLMKISESDNVKVAKDGVTVLIPQPSDDPDDPVSRVLKPSP